MRIYDRIQGEVTLGPADFVARGGEAAVFAKDGVAYKLYHEPGHVLPAGKLAELRAIADPCVIVPERLVVDPASGRPLGYAMRFLADVWAWCQLYPRPFRERHGLGPALALELIGRLRARLDAVHRAAALVVDLNELNVLVSRDLGELYCIDADSYQTPHYPATALAAGVRDPLSVVTGFSEQSDWFAFAVLTFQLLVGAHPYRGSHPIVKDLQERMRLHLSAFDPAVRLPAVCYPVEAIPEPLRSWYRAVLQEGQRRPPPTIDGRTARAVPTLPSRLGSATRLEVTPLGTFEGTILEVVERAGRVVVRTDEGIWVDGQQVAPAVRGRVAVGFSPRTGRPVLASLEPALRLRDLEAGRDLALPLRADELTSCDGRILVRSGARVVELVLAEVGAAVIAGPRLVANVLPNATRLHDGLAVQNLLGAAQLLAFPEAGCCRAVRVPELDQATVVHARLDRNVAMLTLARGPGRYERLVLRLDASWQRYDLKRVADVSPTGASFVTLDTGVCVCLGEQDELELFPARMGAEGARVVADSALTGSLSLGRIGATVTLQRGACLHAVRLR